MILWPLQKPKVQEKAKKKKTHILVCLQKKNAIDLLCDKPKGKHTWFLKKREKNLIIPIILLRVEA